MQQVRLHPLVSVMLMAYNQERWIKEAIEGVFWQTYPNLEIILSDDCSTDSTFERMRQACAQYGGHHQIVLNRNPKNLGLSQHLSKLVRMAKGELVVYACGDDISLPDRVSRIVEMWENNNCGSIVVHSNFDSIDENGKVIQENFSIHDELYMDSKMLCESNMFVVGSTSAYTKNIITDFPELLPDLIHEDCCTPFRASLIGAPILSIKDRLVLYRRVGVTSGYVGNLDFDKLKTFYSRLVVDYEQKIADINHVGKYELLPLAVTKRNAYSFAEQCMNSDSGVFRLLILLLKLRPPLIFSTKQIVKRFLRFELR